MTRNYLTNQELLKELEQRLPDFTMDELTILSKLIMTNMPHHYEGKILKKIEKLSPQFHNSMQETVQQLKKEKVDKQVEKIKKLLANKK